MNKNISSNYPKNIGLALSGGGARGLAHIGVLKVLVQENIPISLISGCSMGGLLGALFAIGYGINEIEEIAVKYTSTREMIHFVDRSPRRRGLIVGRRLRKFLSNYINEDLSFSDTKIPLVVNAVDLLTSKDISISEGKILDAVMATIAVPGVFEPVNISPHLLIDGGILNNLPVNNLYQPNIDIKLAVDVSEDIPSQQPQNNSIYPVRLPVTFMDYYRSHNIMSQKIRDFNLEKYPPDIILRPIMSPEIVMFLGFQRAVEIIKSGEVVATNNINQIIQVINE